MGPSAPELQVYIGFGGGGGRPEKASRTMAGEPLSSAGACAIDLIALREFPSVQAQSLPDCLPDPRG
jgi:hypothetical protein